MKTMLAMTLLAALMASQLLVGCVDRNYTEREADNKIVSAQPTEHITEEPTPELTQTPAPDQYNERDCRILRAFFEQSDESGVKNGEKLFENYDPDDPATWTGKDAGEKAPFVLFDDSGNVEDVSFGFGEDPEAANPSGIELAGELDISGLTALDRFDMRFASADSIRLTGFEDNKEYISVHGTREVLISGGFGERVYASSNEHVSVRLNDGSSDEAFHTFAIDLKAEGDGNVLVSCFGDEHYYVVSIGAYNAQGNSFVGWYDADGRLVSSESEIELSKGDPLFGCEGEFVYTARFE